jgi:hypothetical protein
VCKVTKRFPNRLNRGGEFRDITLGVGGKKFLSSFGVYSVAGGRPRPCMAAVSGTFRCPTVIDLPIESLSAG